MGAVDVTTGPGEALSGPHWIAVLFFCSECKSGKSIADVRVYGDGSRGLMRFMFWDKGLGPDWNQNRAERGRGTGRGETRIDVGGTGLRDIRCQRHGLRREYTAGQLNDLADGARPGRPVKVGL
jgi:hypothetical protein